MDPLRLRNATFSEHRSVERHMPLMEPGLTHERYVAVLQHIFPLVAGWERLAALYSPPELRPLMAHRERTPLLHADLIRLGAAIPAIDGTTRPFDPSTIPGLTPEPSVAALLGAMYVMEGSTLGGQYIARHVEPLLGLCPGEGTSYFRGYGERTGAMWNQFKAAITERPPSEDEAILAAARAMFAGFERAILPLSSASPLA